MPTDRPPTLDPIAAERWQQAQSGESPWLHEEIGRRMQERLEIVRLQPTAWLNWNALHGGLQAHRLVSQRYPNSQCFVPIAPVFNSKFATKLVVNPWWSPKRWHTKAPKLELPQPGTTQMVWANMALHMASEPQALMAAWHQALSVDGFLMFSCLGPDTLVELRDLYRLRDWPAPAHEFTDMHDWGDMLVQAGFAEPVLDMERITLTFESPQRLLAELRGLGRNLHVARFARLRGRGWHKQLCQALADSSPGQPLKLTFEVIYGHALKPAKRLPVQAQTSLTLDEMRQALQLGKSARSG
jgi:malonyl-CoA O-methyltransferase